MLHVRKAVLADFDRMMEIYRGAQEFMIRSGNPTQWAHSYPAPELIEEDIREGVGHVIYDESGIHGVFALFDKPDPTYSFIEDGHWLNDEPYVTIHRVAGDGQVRGIVRCAIEYSKRFASNIRIDTHADNAVMQRQVTKNGFVRCGIIYIADGTPRIAYQWTDSDSTATDRNNQ